MVCHIMLMAKDYMPFGLMGQTIGLLDISQMLKKVNLQLDSFKMTNLSIVQPTLTIGENISIVNGKLI